MIVILDHRMVKAGISFPGRIVYNSNLSRCRRIQAQIDILPTVNQGIIHQQFSARTDMDSII
jgi:hypothetical protein